MTDEEDPVEDWTRLVDQNGLVKLFANRARARILVTLLYAEEPLSVADIAEVANLTQSTVYEALDPLARFGVVDVPEGADPGETDQVALADDDEFVDAVRTLAELATNRFHD